MNKVFIDRRGEDPKPDCRVLFVKSNQVRRLLGRGDFDFLNLYPQNSARNRYRYI